MRTQKIETRTTSAKVARVIGRSVKQIARAGSPEKTVKVSWPIRVI